MLYGFMCYVMLFVNLLILLVKVEKFFLVKRYLRLYFLRDFENVNKLGLSDWNCKYNKNWFLFVLYCWFLWFYFNDDLRVIEVKVFWRENCKL